MKYLFGPVNSRRLGISLGVDIVPHKTCSLNCLYCECGATTNLTLEVKEYTPVKQIITEIDEYLSTDPELDYLTFSGAGEPTLHSGIGKIISHIKDNYPAYKVAVLTNGSLLWKEDVRRSLLKADVVIPSLDAVSQEVFKKILRAHDKLDPQEVIRGLMEFSEDFKGTLILEIFILPGINDSESELKLLKEVAGKIKSDSIQINTLDRPGAMEGLKSANRERLLEIRNYFKPLNAVIIGGPSPKRAYVKNTEDMEKLILSLLKRRPSTINDLCQSLSVEKGELNSVLEQLREKGIIKKESLDRGDFYRLK